MKQVRGRLCRWSDPAVGASALMREDRVLRVMVHITRTFVEWSDR